MNPLSRLAAIGAAVMIFMPATKAVSPFDLDSFYLEVPYPWEPFFHPDSIHRLTEDDFRTVADELGVEVAAIKAVVEIEAGKTHQGFSAPQKPLVNFDLSMFRSLASRRGVSLGRYMSSHPDVFKSGRRTQPEVFSRLESAMQIDTTLAVEATFWGMFQIGGFNWQKCGVSSPEEFVRLMSRSERDQLELFAGFIVNTDLLKHLRNKNWAQFARGYNGPAYARRGYHTRLAAAYRRYKSEEQQ
ncbi:MAG: N-acetylmuramidase family protein [Barnesiella sp.]|nr:N-acetylmuramidase family protein [Barnesiella sp.]MBD5344005.1 N-acetylmuramidase family protein [Bacteroides sp.]